jgi:RNA polymerase sigma-70 factor (ECF subfamily)
MSEETAWNRFRIDGTPAAWDRLVDAYRPLVASVCRRYFRRPQDVEDAVQETFLKLFRHAEAVRGEVASWLISTAHTTSVDMIRVAISERRRRDKLAASAPVAALEHWRTHEAIRVSLTEAMANLDAVSRELLAERFFRKTPLRVIAARQNLSVPTASRRVRDALDTLAAVLRDMGVDAADDLTLAEHFGEWTASTGALGGEALRFAADWSALRDEQAAKDAIPLPLVPGWTRPIRVGAFVSHASAIRPGYRNISITHEEQVRATCLLVHPGFRLIGIVEPDTSEFGPVERTLRQFQLTGGLIDATDTAALRTLDVLIFGINFRLSPAIASAFAEAVRGGVGLLNERWCDVAQLEHANPDVMAMMLAASPVFSFHHPQDCMQRLPAFVREEHSLLPGVREGDSVMAPACGPAYALAPGTRVLLSKDDRSPPIAGRVPFTGVECMPTYALGSLGRGRVLLTNFATQAALRPILSVSPEQHLVDVLAWLAEPRREMPLGV